jgi:hypothetical protein
MEDSSGDILSTSGSVSTNLFDFESDMTDCAPFLIAITAEP